MGADMHLKRLAIIAFAGGLALCGASPSLAQGIETIDRPSEMPPASFSGRQFVDSRGCVFVRAGFDGAVIWVPRVTRDRDQICGYAPTFGGTRAAAEPVRTPARATPPVVAAPKPAPRLAAKPAPAPRPKPAATPRPKRAADPGKPIETVAARRAPVVKAPASKPPLAPPPATVVRQMPATPTARQGAGSICAPGQMGNVEHNGRVVRCGPQSEPYVTEVGRGKAPARARVYRNQGAGRGSWDDSRLEGTTPFAEVSRSDIPLAGVAPRARIVPDQVWRGRAHVAPIVPSGYRPAWEDDRLNPYRAWQTVDGYYETQRRWTNTVPRENPAPAKSRYVRAKDPVLEHPAGVVRAPNVSLRGPVVSTRSAPVAPEGFDTTRYVEIGLFTSGQGAAEAAARLGSAGLPVRYLDGASDRAGARRVVVGPYSDQRALDAALRRVRAVGYVQAYLR
ncbi:sporulation related protein [Citreicella sp. 357]|nr:sporulation related protein [Citreicella sp. 357]